jgi:hypothetical protein
MPKVRNPDDRSGSRGISRREFLKLAAAAGLLAGCRSTRQPPPTPASAPVPSEVVRQPEIIQFYPDVPSKVVQVRHAGVWDGDELVPNALRQILDASITELTGLNDARDAWAALFAPEEQIAIKVNALGGPCPTHLPLVMVVTECLQEAGVPAEQIVVFDRYTSELKAVGYTINRDGPGVRCYGTDESGPAARSSAASGHYVPGGKIMDTTVRLSEILMNCHALINVPILKVAMLREVGMTFAMKNHYGTFDRPADFHGERFQRGVAELNALPPIKDRTRLIIGDALTVKTHRGSQAVGAGNVVLMSFDPVAHDTIGLQMTREALVAAGRDPTAATTAASSWLAHGAELGLGTDDVENIDLVRVKLG